MFGWLAGARIIFFHIHFNQNNISWTYVLQQFPFYHLLSIFFFPLAFAQPLRSQHHLRSFSAKRNVVLYILFDVAYNVLVLD